MRISACVITKNEEKALPRCLESVKDIVFEMIVVDTGSTDQTIQVAKEYGAKVFCFEWINDFSAAKNFAISKAKGDWIIFLDADEYFANETIPLVTKVITYAHKNKFDLIIGLLANYNEETKKMFHSAPQVRIFRNDLNIRYSGAIHERLIRRNYPAKVFNASKEIKIIHTGYSPETMKEKEKSTRNLELLFKELEKNPESSDLAFYISESYMIAHEPEKALEFARKALEYNNRTLVGIYEKNYVNMIMCMRELNFPMQEILQTIYEAIKAYPSFPDFYLILGECYRNTHRIYDSIEAYQNGLQQVKSGITIPTSVITDATIILTIMGRLYYKLKQLPKSVECYVQSLDVDRYNYKSLLELLLIFSKYETTDNAINFFKKIYDTANLKDNVFLLKASLDIRNVSLADYYMSTFSATHKGELNEDNAQLQYIKGNYRQAARLFEHLYQEKKQTEIAVKGITAALLAKDDTLIEKYYQMVTPSLQNLIKTVGGMDGQPATLDKRELMLFLNEHINLREWNELLSYAELINENNLLLDIAESFYREEEYGFALEFYDMHVQKEKEIPEKTLGIILIKMAECLYKSGDNIPALQLLQDAQLLSPDEYAVYELQLIIYAALKDKEGIDRIVGLAKPYFPDSNYINSFSS